MDRLICGDVGYGKTEVALRAAFKAAGDGKQVLVLAPTTILAQQHFGTFTERLQRLPVHDRARQPLPLAGRSSRRRSAKFNEGKVDILIGTHRLLGRDVRAKDLGLIIVDEEQRFGVKQKELLRQLKLKVDVISMSATPIPRTLQMSLAGLRDICVIETPPEGRRPVKTYVGEYDEELVKQALDAREARAAARRSSSTTASTTIDETAERLRGAVPGDAASTVAHGQMDEKPLEERMIGFLRGEADVLVSTSIIESGIDIPQANTLIVERADIFGLAQLYQIRGRVGRSRERAYAYLLYPSARRADRGRGEPAAARSATTPSWAPASRSRCATSSCAAPATCSATSSPATSRRSASSSTCRCSTRPCARWPARATTRELPEPVRLDVNVDAYVPADYIPYEQAKVDVHRRIAGRARGRRARASCAPSSRTASAIAGAAREPDRAPAGAHQARPGGRARRLVPRRPAGGHADRARRRAGARGCAPSSPARSTSRGARSSRCACPTTRTSASRRWCGRRTRCWPSSARPPDELSGSLKPPLPCARPR